VLHAFQKKSKKAIKTPPEEIEMVRSRLKEAERDYTEWTAEQERRKESHY
jgi:phage-related protein